jgi:hypothetical protein
VEAGVAVGVAVGVGVALALVAGVGVGEAKALDPVRIGPPVLQAAAIARMATSEPSRSLDTARKRGDILSSTGCDSGGFVAFG